MTVMKDSSFFTREVWVALGTVLAIPMLTIIYVSGGVAERIEYLERSTRERAIIVDELRKDRATDRSELRKDRDAIISQVRAEADTIIERLTVDYIDRDRRIWDVVRAAEKTAAKDRETIASLQASLGHLAGQLNRIESKIDRVIEQRIPKSLATPRPSGYREQSGG